MEIDKAIQEFKNMFTLTGSIKIVKLMQEAYNGKLMILKILESNNGKLFAGELSEKLGVSTARVAVAIKGLEQKGYVKRRQAEEDARKVVIEITPLGEKILVEHINKVDNVLKENFQKLTIDEMQTFIELGTKLFSNKTDTN